MKKRQRKKNARKRFEFVYGKPIVIEPLRTKPLPTVASGVYAGVAPYLVDIRDWVELMGAFDAGYLPS